MTLIIHNIEFKAVALYPNRRQRFIKKSTLIMPRPSSNLPGLHAHLVFVLAVTLLRQGEDGFDPPASCS